jgi:hypothetical protein
MITPQGASDNLYHYSLTAAAVCIGANAAGGEDVSEPKFSNWLRGTGRFSPEALRQIEVSFAALANICHDGYPWPLNFRSAAMVPLIRKYVEQHKLYLREKAEFDTRNATDGE